MSQVHQQLPNARLLIAGRDTSAYAHAVRSQIVQLRLDGIVQLLGFQEDIPAFLQAIDIFAFASRSEGFGLVVAEAMAAGKPVVASRIPALTEIVVDGETGFLVDPDDSQAFAEAIMILLSHPDKARRMGKRGQERVQRLFSAERMAKQTLALYEALAQYQGSVVRKKAGYPT